MSTQSKGQSQESDDFIHHVAIEVSSPKRPEDSRRFLLTIGYPSFSVQLSRRLNTVNPNDLLAKRVIDIARHNHSGEAFFKAASSFGKFEKDFLLSLHTEILAHLSAVSHHTNGTENGQGSSTERGNMHVGNDGESLDDGMTHESGDVQPASSRQRGGLIRTGDVSRTAVDKSEDKLKWFCL